MKNKLNQFGYTLIITLCVSLLLIFAHRSAAKGKPSNSGGPPFYGRVDFVEGPDMNIRVDGLATCAAGDHPFGGLWDYWDWDDTGACGGENGVYQSDMDTGGRWIFAMGSTLNRYVVFHWEPIGDSPLDPNLDAFLAPDIADPTPGVDNLRIRLNADNLFKVGTDRQLTDINIWEYNAGRTYNLHYTEALYIVRDDNDPDLVLLTTEGDPALGQPNVREAQLLNGNVRGKKNPDRLVGTYEMPVTLIIRRVPAP
jgi:hypothetical protein